MNFPDIIKSVVADVRAEYDTANLKKPYYEYGHPLEIYNILAKKSDSEEFKYDKYPLIALYWASDEKTVMDQVTVEDIVIVIMTETDPNFQAKNRYTNTFDPTLIPIYNLFMEKLKESPYLASDDFYDHIKRDKLYYGVEEEFGNLGNIGNDALDAIIIRDFDLRIIKC